MAEIAASTSTSSLYCEASTSSQAFRLTWAHFEVLRPRDSRVQHSKGLPRDDFAIQSHVTQHAAGPEILRQVLQQGQEPERIQLLRQALTLGSRA